MVISALLTATLLSGNWGVLDEEGRATVLYPRLAQLHTLSVLIVYDDI